MTTDAVAQQWWQLMIDEDKRLGHGWTRVVYPMKHTDEWVVKVEDGARMFQNPLEWMVWRELRNTSLGKWLAPCYDISPNGSVLIQRRTRPPAPSEFPKKIPRFLCNDTKRDNFGIVDGRFCCHDYGYMHGRLLHRDRRDMEEVEWWTWRERRLKKQRDQGERHAVVVPYDDLGEGWKSLTPEQFEACRAARECNRCAPLGRDYVTEFCAGIVKKTGDRERAVKLWRDCVKEWEAGNK